MAIHLERKRFVDCASCFKEESIRDDLVPEGTPDGLLLFHLYMHGWTYYNGLWYCRDCRPEQYKIDPSKHPHYTDYHDYWDNRKPEECKSHFFEKEPYDPYARAIQFDMCDCCRYMNFGYEDDGSSWRMCTVDDPDDSYGHNLYSGHFYGDAINGRLCPYFTCRCHKGRDPAIDKADGTFHVPYNEYYDGD